MSKKEIAMEYFSQGYNCAQSVLLAFKDECGLDADTITKITLPFGGGVARLRSICGSVSGMVMAYGLICCEPGLTEGEKKKEQYMNTQELVNEFSKRNGSFVCGELLSGVKVTEGPAPEVRTPEYYKKRPCKELVGDAAEILEEYLAKNHKNE